MTRAQAWIILKELLKDEIPDVLQNRDADEVSSKGNLFAKVARGAAGAVDTVVSPVGKVVGGGASVISRKPKSSEETEE